MFPSNPPEAKGKRSFSEIKNVSPGKEERLTAFYLLNTYRVRELETNSKTVVSPMSKSGEELNLCLWNLGA